MGGALICLPHTANTYIVVTVSQILNVPYMYFSFKPHNNSQRYILVTCSFSGGFLDE